MTNDDNNTAQDVGTREFREPATTLDLENDIWLGSSANTNNTNRNIAQGSGAGRPKLLIDSDDDMDDDDDDELLMMPSASQKLELRLDQSFVDSTSLNTGSSFFTRSLDPDTIANDTRALNSPKDQTSTGERLLRDDAAITRPSPVAGSLDTQFLPENKQQPRPLEDDDDDDLFGEDFMAQFGDDGELEYELNKNKKPLFARRIPLLDVNGDSNEAGNGSDDLGLERLSISQKHRTMSGAPAVTEITKSIHTATSNTTIISSIPSRMNMFHRNSMGTESTMMMSQSSTQLEEELLEMSARHHDAMLDDLIMEDEALRSEEAGLQDILDMQYQEQELLYSGQSSDISETNKRKHTVSVKTGPSIPATTTTTTTTTTVEDVDRFLDESYAVDDPSLQRTVEASKKTRLKYASSGTSSTRVTEKLIIGRGPRVPELPKHDYTLPPETGPFVTAKNSAGTTFYLAKKARADHSKHSFPEQLKLNEMDAKPLLSMPIHRMMDELDAEIKVQRQETLNRLEYGDYDAPDLGSDSSKDSSERLWVDKYRPKKYTDLMGDERVNREVLSWIKEWDQCVFGRKKKITPEHMKQQFKEFRKPDPFGRPDRKVLLLTGPPGLGKTTMAHVIAKQAGYNVVEVNASDDRTGASVKGKIESALENRSVLGNDVPNLLIIDEIDGVSSSGGEQSFIKLLVDMATVEAASKEEKSKAEGSGGKKFKKYNRQPLMRPIICICNDQYAPVLRPLRTIAQIYQFKKPSVRTIVNRLQQICEIEQVPSDTRAFGVLYDMTEGDMRSCLNTLQFIKNRSRTSMMLASSTNASSDRIGAYSSNGTGEGLTLEALNKATIGRKDQGKSLFSVWEELFQAPYARKSRSALKVMEEGRDGLVKDDNNTYISRMVTLIQANGDYEKLMQGCFENYPSMVFHDVAMGKIVECGDWLAFYDQLNTKVSTNFEYEVGGYIAYTIVNFHRFFAGSVRQKIEYPRKDYESFVAHKANESILQGMTLNLPAKVQRHIQKNNIATELLSPLLRIISPYLRPVNKQLIKPAERMILMRLIDIMIHFQLTFVQEKTEDGQFLYRLEPSIEKLGDFSTIGLKDVLTNRYAVRQLIAQEIEVELVRRAEAAKEAKKETFLGQKGKASASAITASATASATASMDVDPKEDIEREAVDFFGRVIVQPNGSDQGSLDGSLAMGLDAQGRARVKPAKKTRIWYKFNEGFSNAVKAKVFISELL
ncbi:hypothetical protein BG011_000848 [Mortierella polycephala]|uniref:AAA+ ATPase domain-containing protein n=1 Tax=Mortierella polycephala TaxID=41804 RepID=A0A9P6QIS7_9FUNG|nr:hypothetical protein BG011_000848 [Mortierella polycephala]